MAKVKSGLIEKIMAFDNSKIINVIKKKTGLCDIILHESTVHLKLKWDNVDELMKQENIDALHIVMNICSTINEERKIVTTKKKKVTFDEYILYIDIHRYEDYNTLTIPIETCMTKNRLKNLLKIAYRYMYDAECSKYDWEDMILKRLGQSSLMVSIVDSKDATRFIRRMHKSCVDDDKLEKTIKHILKYDINTSARNINEITPRVLHALKAGSENESLQEDTALFEDMARRCNIKFKHLKIYDIKNFISCNYFCMDTFQDAIIEDIEHIIYGFLWDEACWENHTTMDIIMESLRLRFLVLALYVKIIDDINLSENNG